jgi:hypothetical protein
MVQQAGAPVRAGDVVPIEAQIRCVQRELAQRRSVYPRLVAAHKLRSEDAARETWTMQAVLDTLNRVAGQPSAVQPGLEV